MEPWGTARAVKAWRDSHLSSCAMNDNDGLARIISIFHDRLKTFRPSSAARCLYKT